MPRPVDRSVDSLFASLVPAGSTPFKPLEGSGHDAGVAPVDIAAAPRPAGHQAADGAASLARLAHEDASGHRADAGAGTVSLAAGADNGDRAGGPVQPAGAGLVIPSETAAAGPQIGAGAMPAPFAGSTAADGGGAAATGGITADAAPAAPAAAAPSASPVSFAAATPGPAYSSAPTTDAAAAPAVATPSGSEGEISFLCGITSAGKVGSPAWGLWNFDAPATYASTGNIYKWGSTTPGTSGGTVTYWFDTGSNWTSTEQSVLLSGLALWQAETNITFSPAASAAAANFSFIRGSDGKANWGTLTSTTGTVGNSTEGQIQTGRISIDTSVPGFGPLDGNFDTAGGYVYNTLVHEMGHMLGLGHAGPYNNGDGLGSVSARQFSVYDTRLWSIMSYIDPWDTTAAYYSSYPVTGTSWGRNSAGFQYEGTTPMILDILAAQRVYGAPTSTPLSGGQTFGFNTNITGTIQSYFDFTVNAHPIITLWDAGANNRLDLSGFTVASTVSLVAGTFSSVNGMVNNLGIAEGTVIDTAIGGSGNDNIGGNTDANTLTGGAGDDTISGGAGNDTIDGGQGADLMIGGTGNDTFIVDNPADLVLEYSGQGVDTVKTALSSYTLPITVLGSTTYVENLTFTGSGGFTGTGNGFNNVITGGTGNDTLNGGGGLDTLNGGAGNDTLNGGTGADTMNGGFGNDTFIVDSYSDVVNEKLNQGSDTIDTALVSYTLPDNVEKLVYTGTGNFSGTGNGLANTLTGGPGFDELNGGAGADTMIGGLSGDQYFVDDPGDVVTENANGGTDTVNSTITYTLPANVETLALLGTDLINGFGNGLNNTLVGNSAHNVLRGGGGADTLYSTTGSDNLWGDSGADDFIFSGTDEYAEINDFDQGNNGSYSGFENDQIDLAPILDGVYDGGVVAVSDLVQLVVDPLGFTDLEISLDGSGSNWLTIAQLDGVSLGENVNIVLDPNQSGGTNVTPEGRHLTFAGTFYSDNTFDPNWNDYYTFRDSDGHITGYAAAWDNQFGSATFPVATDELTVTNDITSILIGTDINGQTDAADSLTITAGAGVTMQSGDLVLGTGVGNSGWSLYNSGTMTIVNGNLTVNGDIYNAGLIELATNGDNFFDGNAALIVAGDISLSGVGDVVLTPNGANLNEITGNSTSVPAMLHNVDNTISGVGTIGTGSLYGDSGYVLALDNQSAGKIDANIVGGTLLLNPTAIANDGVLIASLGTLHILNTKITQTAIGIIGASAIGSTVALEGVTIAGGLLQASDGTIETVGNADVLDNNSAGSITNLGVFTIASNSSAILQGTFHNQGELLLASNGDNFFDGNAAINIALGGATLDGGGSVVMQQNGTNFNEITGSSATLTATLHNVNNTISGAGTIGDGTLYGDPGYLLALDNQAAGVVNATTSSALSLLNLTVTNTGVLEDTATGGLNLQNTTVTQTGGTIEAVGAGSHVDLNNATIKGGLLTTSGGGIIHVVGGSNLLDGSTACGPINNAGSFVVESNNAVTFAGTIHNTGTVTLQTNGDNFFDGNAVINIDTGDVTLNGGGNIVMAANGTNYNEITGSSNAATATLHNVDNTISGAGGIGIGNLYGDPGNLLAFDNQAAGTVDANLSGDQILLSLLTVSNAGIIEATAGGTISLSQATVNQSGAGVLRADGAGSHIDLNTATIAGGLLATANGGVFRIVSGTDILDGSTALGAINNSGSLVVLTNNSVTLAGTIHNTGTITLQTNGNNFFDGNTSISIAAGDVTLTGGGGIVFQPTGTNFNEITGWSSSQSTTLHNVDNTISGAGTIGANGLYGDAGLLLELDNQAGGTVNANTTGQQLALRSLNVTNSGILEATGGGTLALIAATITLTGSGVIRADGTGSHVDLNDATIYGGEIVTTTGGFFEVTGGTDILDGSTASGAVTNAAAFRVGSNLSLQLKGTIHNDASITLTTNGDNFFDGNTVLTVAADTTLDGGGSIVMQANGKDFNEITGFSPGTSTTLHNLNNTISGAGTIGHGGLYGDPGNLLAFDNQAAGTVDANVAGNALALNSLTVSNAGTVEATLGGIIAVLNATIDQTGAGIIRADGAGSHVDLNNATIAGGQIASTSGGFFEVTGGTDILDGSTGFGAVTNAAAFKIGSNLALQLKGTIHNSGSITLQTNGNNFFDGNTTLIIAADTTLDGGGSIVLQANGTDFNEITGTNPGSAQTLHNVNNTISGAGTIGAGGEYGDPGDALIFDNEAGGTVDANVLGHRLMINTGATVTNNGIFEADAGTLLIDDAVTGSGHALVTDGGTLVLNGADDQDITFSGAGHVVLPGAAVSLGGYTGDISGWQSDDTVDVSGLGYQSSYWVKIALSGTSQFLYVLDSANGNKVVAKIGVTGTYVASNFGLSDDGNGGTLINLRPSTPAGLAIAVASDQGGAGDKFKLTGTGDIGDTVTVYDGVTVVGTATVAADGTWSITTASLAAGAHSLATNETDAFGLTSGTTAAVQVNVTLGAPNAVAYTGTGDADQLTGGTGGDWLSGGDGNDILTGGAGSDTLDGGVGADTMSGGNGNDVYSVDDAGDVVNEAAGQGTDTVDTTLSSYTLGANVENLVFVGTGAFTGTGNTLANTLVGGAGNDTLNGGAGNDTLDGGAGADALNGGLGNDVYIVDDAGDVVTENAGAGNDTVKTSLSSYALTANVENLVYTGTGDFTGTGNNLNNTITGGAGNDTLTGGSGMDKLNGGGGNDVLNGNIGADTMTGGTGDDTYFVDNAGDLVVEAAGEGSDTVKTTLAAYTLTANVENLVFTGTGGFAGTGNVLANTMTGGIGNDTLNGGAANDTLNGGAGDDTLDGGVGNDLLTGGNGSDAFLFDTGLNGTTNVDQVFDFNSVSDKVLLSSSIFAAAGPLGTLAAGAFVIGSAATAADDRIVYNSATGALSYDKDGVGGTAQVQFATLSTGLALTNNNFQIV